MTTSSSCCGVKRGFTLVELSVVVLIAALMLGFGLKMLQGGTPKNCYPQTRMQMQDIQSALEHYVQHHGRYPRPARTDLGAGNGLFGAEAASGITSSGGVLIGALPVQVLDLPASHAADCWGKLFTYAVTDVLTTTMGYASGAYGAITVRHGPLASSSVLTTTGAFVVVSHGEDGDGATTLTTGSSSTPGSCTVSGSKIDRQNCNGDATFFDAPFNNGAQAADFYDDLILYISRPTTLVDCEAGTDVLWGSDQCGATLSKLLADGEALTAISSITPPGQPGFDGTANITCQAGTLVTSATSCSSGSCPMGCSFTDPRGGSELCMGEGSGRSYGPGICKRYRCCASMILVEDLSNCPIADGMEESDPCTP